MQINNIDLHYHAGQERPKDMTVFDYVDYARRSGRKILGLTDHYGRYFPGLPAEKYANYPGSMQGLLQYRDDVEAVKGSFPDMKICFAPELGEHVKAGDLPPPVVCASDYFICEPGHSEESIEENTALMLESIENAANISEATGRPVYVAHPFRFMVNRRVVKKTIDPKFSEIPYRTGLKAYSHKELSEFFLMDLRKVGTSAAKLDIPLEVNGETHYRLQSHNMPALVKMLWASFGILADCGAQLVPGSDLHGFRYGKVGSTGRHVPFECFELLGIGVGDIKFLERI